MSQIAVIAEPGLAIPWARDLLADGHKTDCYSGPSGIEELFATANPEILVIDIENPEWSEGMLIPQARAAWPDSKIVAVVSNYAFRASAVYEMGLWEPDQLLLKPLAARLLTATVNFLWAQLRTEELMRAITQRSIVLPGDSICQEDAEGADSAEKPSEIEYRHAARG